MARCCWPAPAFLGRLRTRRLPSPFSARGTKVIPRLGRSFPNALVCRAPGLPFRERFARQASVEARQRRVELTFVGYGYDTIELRITNSTGSQLLLVSSFALETGSKIVMEHSTLELRSKPVRLRSESIPQQIVIRCQPLPPVSRLRRLRAALLKKIGIDTMGTNFTLSVDLPPLDSVPLPPRL